VGGGGDCSTAMSGACKSPFPLINLGRQGTRLNALIASTLFMWLKFDCGCFETMQFAYKFSPLEGRGEGAQLLLWGTPDLGVCCGGGDKGLLC